MTDALSETVSRAKSYVEIEEWLARGKDYSCPHAVPHCGSFMCLPEKNPTHYIFSYKPPSSVEGIVIHVFDRDSRSGAMLCGGRGKGVSTSSLDHRDTDPLRSHPHYHVSFDRAKDVQVTCDGCRDVFEARQRAAAARYDGAPRAEDKCTHGRFSGCVDCLNEKASNDPRSGSDRRAPRVEKFLVGSYVRVEKQEPEADVPSYKGCKGKVWNTYVDWTFRVNRVDEDDERFLFCTPTAGTSEINMKCDKFRLPVSILCPAVGVVESAPVEEPRLGKNTAPSVEKPDMVLHPKHYGGEGVHEVWNCLDAWQQGKLVQDAHLWQSVKYIARAGAKGDELEDLKKARVYLDRAIARREKKS